MKPRNLAFLLMFLAPAFWATNQLGARYVADFFPPHQLAFWRWLIAFCVMLPFAWPRLRVAGPIIRHEWHEFLLLGGIGMWICGAFVYIGAQTTTATNLSLIYAGSPVVIILFSTLIYGEKLTVPQASGAAICIAGILLIIAKGSTATFAHLAFTVGDLWIAVASIGWALYSVLLKHRSTQLDPFTRLTCITAGGVLVLVPFTLWEMAFVAVAPLTTKTVVVALVLGIVPGFGAYQSYSFIQKTLPSHIGGLVLYVIPLYVALGAWLWLGEALRWYHWVGAGLILPGVFVATWQGAASVPEEKTRTGT